MTLTRQLIALILSLFLFIFSGTFWISVENTRAYLSDQLQTQTQNSAESLGISLVPHMRTADRASVDTLVNAMFDSGYYQSLTITSMQGEKMLERHNSRSIEGVPDWFIKRLTLRPAVAETVMTSGWSQAGKLQLTAHPGYAYQKLWQTTYETFWWSMLAFLAAMLSSLLLLRRILKPLHDVEEQAEAICKREFPIVERIPTTRELRRVVEAMNRLSIKVKGSITSLTERAELMRRQAHFDDLTGLMNRRGFLAALEHALSDREHTGSGILLLIRLTHFSDYNRIHGFQAGDDLLTTVAGMITDLADSYPYAVTARTKGAEFSIMLPTSISEDGIKLARECCSGFHDLSGSLQQDGIAHIGLVPFHAGTTAHTLLAHADSALASALHMGPNSYLCSESTTEPDSNRAWDQLISDAMQKRTIQLLSQPVMTDDLRALYRETLIRIQDEAGEEIPPGTFAAMADRLALNSALDRYVIEEVSTLLANDPQHSPLAINLSNRSVHHADFMAWLKSHLLSHPAVASKLLFEISEHAMLDKLEKSRELIDLIHASGGRVVMEHFGRKLSSFQTLSQLKLDYIKLDGSYVRNIAESSDNRFFLQTITDIAHGLDIGVIAEHVESEADRESLKQIGISHMQGYLLGEPSPL